MQIKLVLIAGLIVMIPLVIPNFGKWRQHVRFMAIWSGVMFPVVYLVGSRMVGNSMGNKGAIAAGVLCFVALWFIYSPYATGKLKQAL
jgi:hypothetical protein